MLGGYMKVHFANRSFIDTSKAICLVIVVKGVWGWGWGWETRWAGSKGF